MTPLAVIGQEKEVFAFHHLDTRNRHTLVLPPFRGVFRPWFDALLDILREADPDNFPPEPDWINDPNWAPPTVRTALERIEQRIADRDRMLALATADLATLNDKLTAAQDAATAGIRKLLTTQGDELETAVATSLRALGFTVEERDEANVDKYGHRLEDLKVTLDGRDNWESLVEVKGYTSGAKVNDFPQIATRPIVAFALEHQREPATVWHIVNIWKDRNPATRPTTKHPDSDLTPLLNANGALIDTRDLYRALNDVEAGTTTAQAVRDSLLTARGQWHWTPQSTANPRSPHHPLPHTDHAAH